MQGCGNNFVIVDAVEGATTENPSELSKQINDPHRGVGGDGLILVEKGEAHPFKMRMFNPDGSESEMCGNGIRCVARLMSDKRHTIEDAFVVETGAGDLSLQLVDAGVRVDMGAAGTQRGQIPMIGPPDDSALDFDIELGETAMRASAVSMGNPHCVIVVDDVAAVPLATWGPQVENDRLFPERTNVHFIEVESPSRIVQRTWERGAGATLACGTGACASVVAAHLLGLASRTCRVHLPGGELNIEYAEDGRVYMTGPAEYVFEGTWAA